MGPGHSDTAQVESALLHVLENILNTHRETVSELQQFLGKGGEIIYVFGNHDRLIGLYPAAQELIRKKLCPSDAHSGQIQFMSYFEDSELGLYVEHGQRFDPFNHENYKQSPPFGDVINILIVNRFVDEAVKKLLKAGYSPDLVEEIETRLQQVEYLRPLSLGPYWLTSVSEQYRTHPGSSGKSISIDRIIQDVTKETLLDQRLISIFARRFWVPTSLLKLIFQLLLVFPALLPILSFVVSRLRYKTKSNDFQYHMAQRIHQEKRRHLICFGHTHIPSLIPITEEDYYFNTGCWKPVIYLFRHAEDYFFPKRPFNRIERSGIFKVEKNLNESNSPVSFSLLMVQNGVLTSTN